MADKSSPSIWLQLYFVCASLLGLILISIGSVTLINMTLNSTVLKVESTVNQMPPMPYISSESITNNTQLSEEDKKALQQWNQEYTRWQESESKRDYQAENRKQGLAMGLALLVTGFPIFTLHAPLLFRQFKV